MRVPPPQSVELFRALRTNGVPTHLYMAPREPHVFQELRHALFKINVELEWFERKASERALALTYASLKGHEGETMRRTASTAGFSTTVVRISRSMIGLAASFSE